MALITISIPDHLLELVNQQRGKTLSAKVCAALAESLGTEYEPPKRGGRRIPRDITAEEFAQVKGQSADTTQPSKPPAPKPAVTPPAPKQPIAPPAPLKEKAATPHATHKQTMAERGEHYAQIRPGGHFTGRTVAKDDVPQIAGRVNPQWVFVGDMLYEDFEKRAKA